MNHVIMKTHFIFAILIAFLMGLSYCPMIANAQQENLYESSNNKRATPWVTAEAKVTNLYFHTFFSQAASRNVSYHIYLPKAYNQNTNVRFPVLYWLHGTKGGIRSLPEVTAFFDQAIVERKIPPMLIVFPNGLSASMWCDSKDGAVPIETVVIKELLPLIDSNYRTIASWKGRIIEGFSMGGYGAARLGMKYPELFAGISILAGGPLQPEFSYDIGPDRNVERRVQVLQSVYGNDQDYFKAESPWFLAEKNAQVIRNQIKIRQLVGSEDFTLYYNKAFDERLKRLNIKNDFNILPDIGHNSMAIFKKYGNKNWDFYKEIFGDSSLSYQ